ncbi:pimeloyl-ACP methyl ester carboxylesterase [Paraburkholderia caballeronis]|uniref:alpha/beta fold hydrolase n=1 Tax=Paraburkholderia caballeronis TaxID=416943 RepID=UPI0010653590|nr:alpha/beta hydrolase [Paraburkholderia caballeronis]TDV39372.1 pimeloyl-ACP methyl ester carboxylesterase [Paraburkholderia caballeronis]
MSTDIQFADLPATATRGALRLEYRWIDAARADAPLAVFLHEGLGSIAMWRDWPRSLCERLGMRGLVWSRPGYGRSTPRPHDVKWPADFLSQQARDVMPALFDALGIDAGARERMWLIGHSDGGSIALLYAAAFPRALAGAVVIAPHVFVEDVAVENIAATKAAYESGDLRAKLARYHDDVDSAFYGWSDIWLNPDFRQWNIVETLRTIRCPLLAVQAHDDHYGTMAQIDTIGTPVRHARIHPLARGGHSPHRDAPEALNDAIVGFVHDQQAHTSTA